MLTKAARYGTTDGTSSRDERIDRLKLQIRNHILMLNDAAVLSRAWFEMAENMIAVGRFATIEASAPIQIEKNLNEQAGRKHNGTLWDQERDEVSVRVLLEEGKLNLSLRVLQQYMQVAMRPDLFQASVKRFALETALPEVKIMDVCREFEVSLGQLLRAAVRHVEVMQILDIPCLLQHCRDVIKHGVDSSTLGRLGEHQEGMQKSTVIYYLNSLAQHMELLDEERILELLDAHQIVHLVAVYTGKQHQAYFSAADTAQAVEFLVAVFNSESFTSNAERYETVEIMKAVLEIKGSVLEPALAAATDSELRRNLRRFLDRLNSFQRRNRSSLSS